jgi:mRNA-degrading endonuclease toxin of MazEF toxin-antitoxin module
MRLECKIALDQIRAVDKARLVKKMGRLEGGIPAAVLGILQEMFAP